MHPPPIPTTFSTTTKDASAAYTEGLSFPSWEGRLPLMLFPTTNTEGLSFPSCEGTLPLMLFSSRRLRDQGRRSGVTREHRCMQCQCDRVLPLRAAEPPRPGPFPPLSCNSLEAGVPRCSSSQQLQRSEPPELRGHAAAQAVFAKDPARGAPERDRREGGKCDAAIHPPCPPAPYPATAWRRGGRGAVAHSVCSMVSSPSCEGKLPLRSILLRLLREGRRSRRRDGRASTWEATGG